MSTTRIRSGFIRAAQLFIGDPKEYNNPAIEFIHFNGAKQRIEAINGPSMISIPVKLPTDIDKLYRFPECELFDWIDIDFDNDIFKTFDLFNNFKGRHFVKMNNTYKFPDLEKADVGNRTATDAIFIDPRFLKAIGDAMGSGYFQKSMLIELHGPCGGIKATATDGNLRGASIFVKPLQFDKSCEFLTKPEAEAEHILSKINTKDLLGEIEKRTRNAGEQ